MLAASSATFAGRAGARELLDQARGVCLGSLCDDDAMPVEQWDAPLTVLDSCRGVDVNMHALEPPLAAVAATAVATRLDRALRITERVVNGLGPAHGWRLSVRLAAGRRAFALRVGYAGGVGRPPAPTGSSILSTCGGPVMRLRMH